MCVHARALRMRSWHAHALPTCQWHNCMQALCASARPNGQQAVVFVADVSETFSPAQLSIQASYAQAAIGDAGNTSLPVTFRQVGSRFSRSTEDPM